MKFEDKLIELRKKAGLSQEQLAEKLDVTRQTISKWELGQSKPDMDKLTLMSKLYDINIDELVDESKKGISKKGKEVNYNKRKIILYIVIVLFIACIVLLGYRLLSSAKNNKDNSIFNATNKTSVDNFNRSFEMYTGKHYGSIVDGLISDVITNNKKNIDHQIEFIFDGTSYGTDTNKIKEVKSLINVTDQYDVSYEYDEKGYINKFILDKVVKDVSASSFNFSFEVYAGENYGSHLESMISDLITSNKKYANHQIELIFDGTSYGTDTDKITNKKYELDTFTKYDVSYEYDEKGYINKFIVVTR